MFSKEELKQMILEAMPKVIPQSSPRHPKHAEWKAANAKPRTAKDPDAKLLHPIKTDTHEHLIKAIDKYGPGKVDHILKTRPVVTTHNGKKVAGVHVTAYHGINNKRDLGMDDDGESEEIFHHIVHRHADNPSKLDSYQTSAKMREEVELEEADRGYDSGSTRHSVVEIKKDFPKHFTSDNITVHPHVNDSMHHLVIDHDTHNYGTVLHPRKGDAKKSPVWSDAPEVESPTAFMGKKEREAAYQKIAKIYAPHKLKEEVELEEDNGRWEWDKDGNLIPQKSAEEVAKETKAKISKFGSIMKQKVNSKLSKGD